MTGLLDREHLALLSAVLTAICVLPYLRDIRRGTTRPQRVSWFVFAFLAMVAAAAQVAEGADAGAWLCAGAAVGFTAVFIVSLRHGEGGGSRLDHVALVVVGMGLVAQAVLGQPLVALVAVILAEIAAIALTARKAFADPGSETASTWIIDGLAGIAAIAAVEDLSVTELLYPVHHTLVNGLVVAAVVLGRRASAPAPVERRAEPAHAA